MSRPSDGLWPITTFGLGHLRPASGTWGSLPPAVVGAGLVLAGLGPFGSVMGATVFVSTMAAFLVAFALACVLQGDRAEAVFGKKDPGQAVADETSGMALTLLVALPWNGTAWANPGVSLLTIAFAFVAFRAMDVLKPWPAHALQRVPGGWGILLDDLVAAVQAGAIVQIVAHLTLR